MKHIAATVAGALIFALASSAVVAQKGANSETFGGAPRADLREVVIWGSQLEAPVAGLAFGGQDQSAQDGRPHTRMLLGGKWRPILDQLRADNPLQDAHDELRVLEDKLGDLLARARYVYFQGQSLAAQQAALDKFVHPTLSALRASLAQVVDSLDARSGLPDYETGQLRYAKQLLLTAADALRPLDSALQAADLGRLREGQLRLQQAAEAFDAEPPARAASPLAWDSKTGLFVLFGGDHFDYQTNDVWVFDPGASRWNQRHPDMAPPPRANHKIEASGDGKIAIWSGYIYLDKFNSTHPPYQPLGDARWVYDIEVNSWAKPRGEDSVPANTRQYRSAPYLPEYYMQGERPDAAAHAQRLASLPANTWVSMKPPHRPQHEQMARDWGTSVRSPDHDLFLQWGGGHSAHCGTDVLHYHFATNRWEQPYPVEVCLGQVYSTSHYPGGYNFNRNPWIIMHAYKSYAYDTSLKRLVLTGRTNNWKYRHDPYFYLYDPLKGDWTQRHPLHPEMYKHVHYVLNTRVHASPKGVLMWGKDNSAFQLDTKNLKWHKLDYDGRLPTSGTDGGGLVYDPPRDRMLMVTKPWKQGGSVFQGKIHALDLGTMKAATLSPAGRSKVPKLFLREAAYNSEFDVFLWAWQDHKEKGRMVVYEPAGNRWLTVAVGGDAPFWFSTGHIYDERRKLHWVTDNNGNVYALRLDLPTADPRPL